MLTALAHAFRLPTVLTITPRHAATLSLLLDSLLFCNAPLVAGDGYPRQPAFDIQHYRLQISISDTTDAIEGKAEVQVRVVDSSVHRLIFDLREMWVSEVREAGDSVAFSHLEGRLAIDLQKNYERGAQLSIMVVYRGAPQDGLIISQNKNGQRTFFADNWPDRARHWFPSIDHPSDKATVEFTITSPQQYEVVANGRLLFTSDNDDGTRTWYWAEQAPIPTYCMVFGAADFSIAQLPNFVVTPTSYYAYPEDSTRAHLNFGRTEKIVECFTKLVGPYPYEKLALVQSTTRYGGMENASAIFFAEKSVAGDRRIEGTNAHEIAHQWFGDSVTQGDWHHLWLSEGFATYFQMLFTEWADGREAFRRELESSKSGYLEFAANNRWPIIDTTIVDYPQLLNDNNYAKGAWVLHMLRSQVGDSAFFRGIREYYRTHRDGNALTADFQKVMEAASGQSLGWFVDQWLWRGGYPELELRWRWEATLGKINLHLIQNQAEGAFRFRLPIKIASGGRTFEEIFEVDEKEETIELALPLKPEQVFVDSEETVLKTVTLVEESDADTTSQAR